MLNIICPECGRHLRAEDSIHTCTPPPIVMILRARVAELEGVLARVRCCKDACCPQCAEEIATLGIKLP